MALRPVAGCVLMTGCSTSGMSLTMSASLLPGAYFLALPRWIARRPRSEACSPSGSDSKAAAALANTVSPRDLPFSIGNFAGVQQRPARRGLGVGHVRVPSPARIGVADRLAILDDIGKHQDFRISRKGE